MKSCRTDMTEAELLSFADRFFKATFSGDLDLLKTLYAEDAIIWHNTDRREIGVAENLEIVRKFATILPDQCCEVVRREVLPDGFMQQDLLRATLPDGSPFSQTSCVIVRLKDGLIKRVDEYVDSHELKPVSAFWPAMKDQSSD